MKSVAEEDEEEEAIFEKNYPRSSIFMKITNFAAYNRCETLRDRAHCVLIADRDIRRLDKEIAEADEVIEECGEKIQRDIATLTMKYGISAVVKTTREGLLAEIAKGRIFTASEKRAIINAIEKRRDARHTLAVTSGMRDMTEKMRRQHQVAIREMTVNRSFYANALDSAAKLKSTTDIQENITALETIQASLALQDEDPFSETQKHYYSSSSSQTKDRAADEFTQLICEAFYPTSNVSSSLSRSTSTSTNASSSKATSRSRSDVDVVSAFTYDPFATGGLPQSKRSAANSETKKKNTDESPVILS